MVRLAYEDRTPDSYCFNCEVAFDDVTELMDHLKAEHMPVYDSDSVCIRCHQPGSFASLEQDSGVCSRCLWEANA